MTIGDISGFLAEGEAAVIAGSRQYPPWGQELVLDLVGCDLATITSHAALAQFSADLCKVIDMEAYGPPILERFALDNPDAAGFTLLQLITTSSITFHFSEGRRSAYGNVFSCKRFNADVATAFITRFLGATVMHTEVRNRG